MKPAPHAALPATMSALRAALQAPAPDHAAALPLLLQPPAQPAIAPALLARTQHAGAAARQSAQALYGRCLQHYRQQVQQGGPQDDPARAAAWFVLACRQAVQDGEPAPAALDAVALQCRAALAPLWPAIALRERQSAFEQWALLGVLVAQSATTARSQGAAARANVQRAARGYLHGLLGLAPEALHLTSTGLEVAA